MVSKCTTKRCQIFDNTFVNKVITICCPTKNDDLKILYLVKSRMLCYQIETKVSKMSYLQERAVVTLCKFFAEFILYMYALIVKLHPDLRRAYFSM